MFRLITYLLITVFLITIVRGVIGIIAKAFGEAVRGTRPAARMSTQPGVPVTGELKKDPVCGTYIPTATSLQKAIGGETFYFCSQQCRDRFAART